MRRVVLEVKIYDDELDEFTDTLYSAYQYLSYENPGKNQKALHDLIKDVTTLETDIGGYL